MVFTQVDDGSQKFVMAYINQSNNKTEAEYNLYEGEHFTIVWRFLHFGAIFMVAHSHWS